MHIMNKTNLIRLLAMVSFLAVLAFPLPAQEKEDSVFTFRFLSGKDMFYSPGMNNGSELTRLFDCVDRYKEMIRDSRLSLHVDGYYKSTGNKAENRRIVRTRSNRVKSELITRKGLKEHNFVTRNHEGSGNYVTVRLLPNRGTLPLTQQEQQETVKQEPAVTVPEPQPAVSVPEPEPECTEIVTTTVEESEHDSIVEQSEEVISVEEPVVATPDTLKRRDLKIPLALKTNLLGYAVLMPNIEIEWLIADRWSVAFEAQGAWYAKNNPHKVYRIATWTPEVRYWVINRARWHGMYVGIFGAPGIYDLCNGEKGHEGEGGMVGVSAGYMWPISKYLSLEAGLGIGYLRVRDKSYVPRDGHFLYQMTKNINYFGPLRLKLSLVWRLEADKTNRKK